MHEDDDEPTMLVPTFAPGAFFADRYRIGALLGAGAMGRVYAANELFGEERRVALKVLHPEQLAEEEAVARFRREAEVLASIGHPCIVEIHAFHQSAEGIPYLAMELLEGVTLKRRLTSVGPFDDPRRLQEILDCIAAGLSAAHACGVVHRDLKPDNVFLPATGEPRAKLVDFGLSRMAKQDKSLTHRGMMLGTPRYMAPEQIRNAAAAGAAGDLYSLGVVLYESLSGKSPYPAEDYGQLLGCVLEGKITPLENVRPDLPPALAGVIARALHADPNQRFRSAGDFADAYGAAIGSPSRWQAWTDVRSERRSGRRTMMPAPMESKETTLAFDASTVGLPSLSFTPLLSEPTPAPSSERDSLAEPASSPTPSTVEPSPTPDPSPPTKRDTVVLASVAHASFVAPSHAPVPNATPHSYSVGGPHHAVMPPASPPVANTRRRTRSGVVLFFVALLVVVLVAAATGFGLRAYQRGSLPIPAFAN